MDNWYEKANKKLEEVESGQVIEPPKRPQRMDLGPWKAEFVSLMRARSGCDVELWVCQQCGKCSSICPVSRETPGFTPRRIIAKLTLGKIDELLYSEEIWKCNSCKDCVEICPEKLSPYDFIQVLREIAIKEIMKTGNYMQALEILKAQSNLRVGK